MLIKAHAFVDLAAEGVRGGGGAREEDSAEDAVRAILRRLTDRSVQAKQDPFEAVIELITSKGLISECCYDITTQ